MVMVIVCGVGVFLLIVSIFCALPSGQVDDAHVYNMMRNIIVRNAINNLNREVEQLKIELKTELKIDKDVDKDRLDKLDKSVYDIKILREDCNYLLNKTNEMINLMDYIRCIIKDNKLNEAFLKEFKDELMTNIKCIKDSVKKYEN